MPEGLRGFWNELYALVHHNRRVVGDRDCPERLLGGEEEMKTWQKWVVFLGVGAVLSLLFWLDDYTGIGQVLNPVEFMAMVFVGLGLGKMFQ